MGTLAIKINIPLILNVNIGEDTITVELDDGRTVSFPVTWYPRLLSATKQELENWRLIGTGQGIHWEDSDEDFSVEGILAGRSSGESQASLKR